MKREIKFKAKRVDNGECVHGDYCKSSFSYYIRQHNSDGGFEDFKIDNETVCQFTGLTDENGVEIYEGDVLTHGEVIYVHGCLTIRTLKGNHVGLLSSYAFETLVIGNIHDKNE